MPAVAVVVVKVLQFNIGKKYLNASRILGGIFMDMGVVINYYIVCKFISLNN